MTDSRVSIATIRRELAEMLAGAAGGSEAMWSAAIGAVELLPIATNPRCNWRVSPTGPAARRDAIARAVALYADAHPYARD